MTYHLVYLLGQPDDHAKETSCESSTAQKFISQKQIPSFQPKGESEGDVTLTDEEWIVSFSTRSC
jgi:hypothetical protein